MDKNLGISIYPEKQNLDEMIKYIDKAKKYGFNRLFTSIIQATPKNKNELFDKMSKVCLHAKEIGYEVAVDMAPQTFELYGINVPGDLSWFEKLGVDIIRMDEHYDGITEANMTHNPQKFKIEINMSSFKHTASLIMEAGGLKSKLLGCHNFYPQKDSGLSFDHFLENSKHYKKLGLRTAAFVTSQTGKVGPWENEGLPTIEDHRYLPITTQAKHLWATGYIDDIIISTAYASSEELRQLSQINPDKICLDVVATKPLQETERKIIEHKQHYRRGDITPRFVRMTMTRVIYKDLSIKPDNKPLKQSFGDIFIVNDNDKRYKGEIHIGLESLEATSTKNLVAQVADYDRFLIPYIGSWSQFELKIINGHGKDPKYVGPIKK